MYDRHHDAEENKRITETVAAHIMALVKGAPAGKVVPIRRWDRRQRLTLTQKKGCQAGGAPRGGAITSLPTRLPESDGLKCPSSGPMGPIELIA